MIHHREFENFFSCKMFLGCFVTFKMSLFETKVMGGFLFSLPKKGKFTMQLVFQTIFVSSKDMQPPSIKVIKALTKM